MTTNKIPKTLGKHRNVNKTKDLTKISKCPTTSIENKF
jgi:hypothetical protein